MPDDFIFDAALRAEAPPQAWAPPLAALFWDAKGSWERAHSLVAPLDDSREAAWVHAYLHRREGDAFNARYWYGRAGRPVATVPLDAERNAIAAALLEQP